MDLSDCLSIPIQFNSKYEIATPKPNQIPKSIIPIPAWLALLSQTKRRNRCVLFDFQTSKFKT